MDEKNIYLNLGENKVSVKQSASGYWYVNELSVSCLSIMDGLVLMDKAIGEATKLLDKYNQKPDELKNGKPKK